MKNKIEKLKLEYGLSNADIQEFTDYISRRVKENRLKINEVIEQVNKLLRI